MHDDLTRTSRFIALVLRHKPEAAGIALDEHGWARVDELSAGVSRTRPMDRETLERIVAEDEKQRYAFNEDHSLIRASQGHSVRVDVEPEETAPPAVLYHGTGERSVPAILREGLRPMGRLHVHLSPDVPTALKVGRRHGTPALFRVDTGLMAEHGFPFWRSANGVWLTRFVPPVYLERMEAPDGPRHQTDKEDET